MKCIYCNGTGKYKKPKDQERYERLVDIEMDKGYFINADMASEKALKEVGYDLVDCPVCSKSAQEPVLLVIDKDECPESDHVIIDRECGGCGHYKGFQLVNGQRCIKCGFFANNK